MIRRLLPILLLLCAMPAFAVDFYYHAPIPHPMVIPSVQQIADADLTTWFVRTDGGPRYDAANNPTGDSCDGKADAAMVTSGGSNQHCAFGDFRLLYNEPIQINTAPNPDTAWGWIIVGGDTVVDRKAQNRIGWDNNTGNGAGNLQCWFAPSGFGSNTGCFNPPIPAGTSLAHTRILSGCAFDGNCTPINTTDRPPTGLNETQLYGGFGTLFMFNLSDTQYVDVAGFELTAHNGACSHYGNPGYPAVCSPNIPGANDYSDNGIQVDANTANVSLTDMAIHGFTGRGIQGPIGAGISLTRVYVGFNGFAGWDFDRSDAPNGTGASIAASYVLMEGNGCTEQYPITNAQFPALACYDDNSNGFGDSWSGQDATLTSFTCDHCTQIYNTKDGFIGPHTVITNLQITNGSAYGNMGEQWKWATGPNSSMQMLNSFALGNCLRMGTQLPGAARNFAAIGATGVTISGGTTAVISVASTGTFSIGTPIALVGFGGASAGFDGVAGTVTAVGSGTITATLGTSETNGTYTDGGAVSANGQSISDLCRANGDVFSIRTDANSTNLIAGTTVAGYTEVIFDMFCGTAGACGASPFVYKDDVMLGYTTSLGQYPFTGASPGLYLNEDSSNSSSATYSVEFGIQSGDTGGTGNIFTDPFLTDEVVQGSYPPETAFDTFIANGWRPCTATGTGCNGTSPAIHAGIAVSGMTTDFYGVTRPNPPSIGAAEPVSIPTAATPTFSPVAGTYVGPQSVTISTTSAGAILCYNTTGSPATNGTTGCTTGTLYSGPVTVSSSETLFAVAGGTGYLDSSVGSAAYIINAPTVSTPTASPVAGIYVGTQSVSLSTVTSGATVCYTLDGTTPTATVAGTCDQNTYSTGLSIASTTTIKAIGTKVGDTNSGVFSGLYTITAPPAVNFSIQGIANIQGVAVGQ